MTQKEHPIESATLADKIAYIRMVAEVYTPMRAALVAKALGLDTAALLDNKRDQQE